MRKADYAALAAVIKQEIQSQTRLWPCGATVENGVCHDPASVARVHALQSLARRLTWRLSVNRAEFLRACGIEP